METSVIPWRPRLFVLAGAALFLLHFFLPWKLREPENDFVKRDGEWTEIRVVHEPESCLDALGRDPVSHFSVLIPAFLMLAFVTGALRPDFAKDLSSVARVLAGISAVGTFVIAAFLIVLLPVGLLTSDTLSEELVAILLTLLMAAFLSVSSWLAWKAARLRPADDVGNELRFYLCHAAIVLAGFPLADLLVYFSPDYGAQGYASTLLCGLLGWTAMLIGALGLAKSARAKVNV